MTVSQAAQALYTAMAAAGFPDVTQTSDGTGVSFSNNTSGSFAINVSESWSDNGTASISSGGLSATIDIADVNIQQQPSVSLSSSAYAFSWLNRPVTFTATVEGSNSTPTGSVTFIDGDNVLETVTLGANGIATYATSILTLGRHNIIAIYSGDSTFIDSEWSLSQTITN